MNTKTADTKGRVALGQKFAGRTFIVKEESESGDIILTPGAVIPEREMWLFNINYFFVAFLMSAAR